MKMIDVFVINLNKDKLSVLNSLKMYFSFLAGINTWLFFYSSEKSVLY